MRILMLLGKSFREDARVRKEAAALQAAGHEVTVVEWARHAPEAPDRETVHGVPVVRYKERGLRRLVPGVVLRNPLWWRGAARIGSRLHRERPFDIVHAHDLDTLPTAVRIKRKTGVRVVFDAHEIFSRMVRADRGPLVAGAADRLERRLLRHVDRIVTVNDALADHYRARTDRPVTVVMNAPEPVPRPPAWPPAAPFIIVYVGLLHPSRFFPAAVDTLGALPEVRFLVAGKREGNYHEVEAAAARYPNVEFLGAIPSDQVLATLGRGHAVLCMLDPSDPQYQVATATKALDAMAVSRPVITTEGTYTGRLVTECGSGLVVPYTREGLVDAVRRLMRTPDLAERLGRAGREWAGRRYNWPSQARLLVAVYAELEATR